MCSAEKSIEDIAGHFDDHLVPTQETRHPFAGAGVKDLALAAAGRAAGPARIEAARRVETEGERARPGDFPGFPGFGHQVARTGDHEGIVLLRQIFVADLGLSILFEPDLPHEVSGETGDTAALV